MRIKCKRMLSVLLCIIMICSIIPFGTFDLTASAINTSYCATVAAQWANDHVYNYDSLLWGTGYYNHGGDCANFVSQCLYMGGMNMDSLWSINGYMCRWSTAHNNDRTYAGSYIRVMQLYNYLVHMGAQVINNPDASQVEIGDVILFKNNYGNWAHSSIVCDKINGVPVVAAHSVSGNSDCYKSTDPGYNNNWHLGFSGGNTYLMKMYGSKCVNSNPRSFDVYTVSTYSAVYSSPSSSSGVVSYLLGNDWAHVYQTSNGFGYVFCRGTYGWVRLSNMNFVRHITSPSVDHIWGEWQVITVANCRQDGLSRRICQRCGLTQDKTTKGGHITDPHATCLTEGYCKICGEKTEDALGHDWDAGKVTKKATCLEDGVYTYTCKRDSSHKYTVAIPALGHDFNAVVSLPNCTLTGTTQNKCSRCGYMETKRTGNIWSDWTTENKTIADPPAGYTYKQSDTQYRYRDKKTTTGSSSTMDGWILYDTTWVWGSYGSWSGWQDSSVTSSDSRQVDTRNVVSSYRMVSYCVTDWTHSPNYGRAYYSYAPSGLTIRATYDSDDYTWSADKLNSANTIAEGSMYNLHTDTRGYIGGHGTAYYFGSDVPFYIKSTNYKTQYRYRDRSKVYTYHFYRWTDWSSWSFTKYTASDTREVQTRTVYRYNLAALGHNFTINVRNEYLNRDKLLTEDEANNGTCYTTGKKCSRCGTISPDAAVTKHSFTTWTALSSTEQISYCDNGCGCYITKSTTCTHNWIKQSTVEPTCTTGGYTTYKCSKCSKTKTDDIVNALGHENSGEWVITTPATCTMPGIETAKCVRHDNGVTCSKTYTREIPALGHTMTKFDATEMTCTVDGNTEYYYCSTCDKYFADENGSDEIEGNSWVIEATGHHAGDWVVEQQNGCGVTGWECKYCTNEWCDEITECAENPDHGTHGILLDERPIEEIQPDYYVVRYENAAYDSSKDEWVGTTCCCDGYTYWTCRNCEGTENAHSWLPGVAEAPEVVEALDHNWGEYIVEKASCVHSGSKYKICQSCNTENCENCIYDREIIEAPRTEHEYILAETIETECTAGTPMQHYVCAICGQSECDTCAANGMPHHYWTGDPQSHDIVLDEENSYPPTCTEQGLNHYICTKCDYCYDEIIEPNGHNMALKNTIEASCLEEGFDVYECTVCGFAEKRNTTAPLGHLTTSPFVVTTKATCVTNGLEEQFCTRVSNGVTCGCKLDDEIIPARNHNMGEWYEDPDASVDTDRCRMRDCLNTDETDKYEACTFTETEKHLWGPWIYDGEEEKTHTKTCEYNNKETVTVSCTFTSEVTKKATCTEDGLRTFTCAVCGGQYTEVIPARKHNWTDWYVTVPADLTTEGEERRDCTNTTEEIEYEACDCYETRVTEVTGADYQVLVYEMDTSGTYQLISNKTYRDLVNKYVEVDYEVTTGFYFNREKSTYTGIIARDGSLVLSLFIDRNVHTVKFDDGEYTDFKTLYYGANILKPDDPEKIGYEFVGWSSDGETVAAIPKTVPDRDLSYVAIWKPKNYTITYNYEGGKEVVTYPYTTVIAQYYPPEREGYTFTGWNPELPEKMPAEDLETFATYSKNRYSITYIIEGEQYGDTAVYYYDDEVTPVIPESKTGYDFSGWTPSEPVNMPAENLTLYGEWKPASGIQYKIETYLMNLDGEYDLYKEETLHGITGQDVMAVDTTGEGFTLNEEKSVLTGKILPDGSLVLKVYIDRNIHNISFDDGTTKTEENLYYGSSITAPAEPAKEGYTFKGWSEDGENVVAVLTNVPDRDVAYKAVWEINQYKITYTYGAADDYLVYTETTGDYDSEITAPEDPELEGYTFICWDSDIPANMPADDTVINALWSANEYTITYIVDDEKYDEKTYYFNEEVIKIDEPQKQGYTFSGWDKDEPSNMPAEDIELKGYFAPADGTRYVVETYIMNTSGGYDMSSASFTAKTEDTVNAEYEIPEGFNLNEEKSLLSGVVLPDGSLVLKVYIDRNAHKISFDPNNGEDIIIDETVYGDDIVIPDNPGKEGYTFEGWSEDGENVIDVEETVPDRDIEYIAVWSVNTYTITFTYGNPGNYSVYEKTEYAFGADVANPETPKLTGYTFVLWDDEVPEKMPAEDLVLNALWVAEEYKVTWIVGEEKTEDIYPFGQRIIKPADPVIKGKTFVGWDAEIPETMPANDLVFYACFNPITHIATFVVPDEDGSIVIDGDHYSKYTEVTFCEGDKTLNVPEVPKDDDRYVAYWEDYELGETDIYIRAIYELKSSDNESELITDKNVRYENGKATITLSAFAETLNTKVKYGAEPVDVILLLDTSESMNSNKMSNGKTRLQVLKETANAFIGSVYENAGETGADHRVAIVSFNTGAKRLTGTSDKTAFVDVRTGRASLENTINNKLSIGYGTRPNLGMDITKSILAQYKGDGRNKVVIFLTDGVPSDNGKDFSDSYANNAISLANDIKNIYETSIYSIGVSIDANPDAALVSNPKTVKDKMNSFMHFVSSNYNDAKSMSNGGSKSNSGYFVTADNHETLEKIFSDITAQQISNTITFSNVTFHDTVSKYFTLTIEEEENLREYMMSEYGVPAENIVITRTEEGTDILIKDVSPKAVYESSIQTGYGITITFEVSANEKALDAGFYSVTTEENGEIIKDDIVIAEFNVPDDIQISESRTIVKYLLDGEVYAIEETEAGSQVESYVSGYAEWFSDLVATDDITIIEGEYTTDIRTITWKANDTELVQEYHIGEIIVAPEITPKTGYDFIGWDDVIPFRMGAANLTFKAQFDDHVHNYEITSVSGNCETGVTTVKTCTECGNIIKEKTAAGEHAYTAHIVSIEDQSYAGITCSKCGDVYQEDTVIDYKAIASNNGRNTVMDLTLEENGVSVQPDGQIIVKVALDDSLRYAKKVSVYRVENGSYVEVNSKKDGEFLYLYLTHFSYYVFTTDSSISDVPTYGEVSCGFNGHNFEWVYNNDATYKADGTETQVCTACGEKGETRTKTDSKLQNPLENAVINVTDGTVDYRTIVTLKATASNVPKGFYLAIYDGDKLLVKGDNESVTLSVGEMKNTKTYTVRVIDDEEEIQRDKNNKKLEAKSTITVNGNFFKKIIAFLQMLFGSLPQVTIEPKKR